MPEAEHLVRTMHKQAFPLFSISGEGLDAPQSELLSRGLDTVIFSHAGLEPEVHSSSVFSAHGVHLLLMMDLSWFPHANSGVVRPKV